MDNAALSMSSSHLPVFFLEHRRAQTSAFLAFPLVSKPALDPLNESLLTVIYSQDKQQELVGLVPMCSVKVVALRLDRTVRAH